MSVISGKEDVPAVEAIHGIKHPTGNIWTEERNKNIHDYEVPGFAVSRAFIWMFAKWLSESIFRLLEKVFLTKGSRRRLCTNEGSFFMIGQRQICMASSSIARPATE